MSPLQSLGTGWFAVECKTLTEYDTILWHDHQTKYLLKVVSEERSDETGWWYDEGKGLITDCLIEDVDRSIAEPIQPNLRKYSRYIRTANRSLGI